MLPQTGSVGSVVALALENNNVRSRSLKGGCAADLAGLVCNSLDLLCDTYASISLVDISWRRVTACGQSSWSILNCGRQARFTLLLVLCDRLRQAAECVQGHSRSTCATYYLSPED